VKLHVVTHASIAYQPVSSSASGFEIMLGTLLESLFFCSFDSHMLEHYDGV